MYDKKEVSPELDRLYNSTVRCPYCRARILKYTTKCPKCGVHKIQIFESSNKRAKEIKKQKTGEKIFMCRRRPRDITFTRMAILLFFTGLIGGHNYYVGRKFKAWTMFVLTFIGIIGVFVFPIQIVDGNIVTDSGARAMFGKFFPTDMAFVVSFIMWAIDAIAIVFGLYKYPVRLGDAPDVTKK